MFQINYKKNLTKPTIFHMNYINKQTMFQVNYI